MKNIFKKSYKSIILVVIVSFFVLNIFVPIFNVDANTYYYTVTVSVSGEHTLAVQKNTLNVITDLIIDGQYVAYENSNRDRIADITCDNDDNPTVCYIKATSNEEGWLAFGPNTSFSLYANDRSNNNGPFNSNTNVTIGDYVENTDFGPGGEGPGFSGTAYFLWNCGGQVCTYEVHDLELKTDGTHGVNENDPYIVNYIRESEVVDIFDNTKRLELDDLDEGDYFWTWDDDDFTARLEHEGLSSEQISDIFDTRDQVETWHGLQEYVNYLERISGGAKRAFAIDPTGAKNGVNSISTNGDRSFRATIYDDSKYEGLIFGVREDDYTYFLSSWDPVFINPEIDISGTSKENPAFYDVYLLENNLKFTLNNDRKATNIKSVVPLNVNSKAVTVRKNGDEYTIYFNSNYYDKVLFEVTGENNQKYYFVVNRIFGSTWENMWDREADKLQGGITLLYPDTDSYNDYQVIANVTYSDGSFATIDVPNVKTYQDLYKEGIDHMAYVNEWPDGKGLKAASYGITITKDMVDLYFTAVKKGALDSTNYGGTFAGNGKGIAFDRLNQIINDYYGRGEM